MQLRDNPEHSLSAASNCSEQHAFRPVAAASCSVDSWRWQPDAALLACRFARNRPIATGDVSVRRGCRVFSDTLSPPVYDRDAGRLTGVWRTEPEAESPSPASANASSAGGSGNASAPGSAGGAGAGSGGAGSSETGGQSGEDGTEWDTAQEVDTRMFAGESDVFFLNAVRVRAFPSGGILEASHCHASRGVSDRCYVHTLS